MVSTESKVAAPAPPAATTAPVSKRNVRKGHNASGAVPAKNATNKVTPPSSLSLSSSSTERKTDVPVSRLGKLPGLSITKSYKRKLYPNLKKLHE